MRDSPSQLFTLIRAGHIACGAVALLIAPLAMMTVKGGLWHRRWGKIYFWAMAGVAVTAVGMCWLRSGLFLFLVAIFSFYLALTGYTALWRKKPEDRPSLLDWCAAVAMLLAGTGLIAAGALNTVLGSEPLVSIIFGLIGLLLSGIDLWRFFKPSTNKRAWWFNHMTRFLAAYVATVTAFSVVNFRFLPDIWRWLWPTVIGTVGISIWRAYYKNKFNRNQPAQTPKAP
jgi:hypothetical protein